MYHMRLFQSHTFKFPVPGNTNATVIWMYEVEWRDDINHVFSAQTTCVRIFIKLHERYAIRDYSKFIIWKFLQSVIPTLRMLEVVRRNDDDAITHDGLRVRISDLIQPYLIQRNLSFTRVTRLRAFSNKTLNACKDFNDILHERYAISDYFKFIL
jgi:hypothetical protein